MELGPVEVAPLVAEVVDALSWIAASKTVRIESDFPEGLPPVVADAARVQQVLVNLLGNALKFTPEGGAISLRAERSGDAVTLSVTDTGRGIPEQDLDHIFDRFWQAGDTARLGTGLGLFIVKGIVDAHRGRVWVESTVGAGIRSSSSCRSHRTVASGSPGPSSTGNQNETDFRAGLAPRRAQGRSPYPRYSSSSSMSSGRMARAGMICSSDPTRLARSTVWIESNSVAISSRFSIVTSRRSRSNSARCSALGSSFSLSAQRLDPRVGRDARAHLAREHHRRRRPAADHRGERALERERAQVLVQLAREHHVRAAVVARDDQEHDRPVEVHHRARDLGAVLELQLAHRLGRAVEARQVRQDHRRPVAARGVERARDLLARLREQRPAVPLRRPVRRPVAQARHVLALDADQAHRVAAEVRVPDDRGLRADVAPQRSRWPPSWSMTARISARIENGRLRPGFLSSSNTSPTRLKLLPLVGPCS